MGISCGYVRFSYEIRIYDSETFSNVFKVFSHCGDICIIDEYFIASRKEAFSIYDCHTNVYDNVRPLFIL